MRTISYAVLAVGQEWRVVSERRQIGHFANRGLAFAAALRFGEEAARSGCRAEILYADLGGELHALAMPAPAADHDKLKGDLIALPDQGQRCAARAWEFESSEEAATPPIAATG